MSFIYRHEILLLTNFGTSSGIIFASYLFSSQFKSINFKISSVKHMAPKNVNSKSTRFMVTDIKETVTTYGIVSHVSSAGIMTKSKTIALSHKEVKHALAAPAHHLFQSKMMKLQSIILP